MISMSAHLFIYFFIFMMWSVSFSLSSCCCFLARFCGSLRKNSDNFSDILERIVYGWNVISNYKLNGENGSDDLYGGGGDDKMNGGPGSDECYDEQEKINCELALDKPIT